MRPLYLLNLLFALILHSFAFGQLQDDEIETDEDVPISFSVIENDSDPNEIDPATVDLLPSTPERVTLFNSGNGVFQVNDEGTVTYTPNLNFFGLETLTYSVADKNGDLIGTAMIRVTVVSVNDAPVANDDLGFTSQNVAVEIDVLGNDIDVDSELDPASIDLDQSIPGIQAVRITAHGTWTASGKVVFTPLPTFVGTATNTYTVRDVENSESNVATISIEVTAANTPPVANDDAFSTPEDTPASFNILTNDTDDYGLDPATVDLNPDTPAQETSRSFVQGNVSVNSSGLLSYTPALNYHGTFAFEYTVRDIDGVLSNRGTVTITVTSVNDPPVANPDVTSTDEDTPVSVVVVTNDTDVDGTIDPATVDLNVSVPGIQNTRITANGSYVVDTDGQVTFTPAANFFGTAVIQYTVRDNEGETSNATTITITVNPVNDNPVANNDAASTNKNTPISFSVTNNDTDDVSINPATVDLDPSVPGIQNTLTIAAGVFTVNSLGVVTFTPTFNFFGVATATYTVNDNEGATSNIATITVTVVHVNAKPIAVPDNVTTDEDTPVTFNVLANDSDDISLNPATVDLNVSVAGIQNTRTITAGTFVVDASGNVTFTPALNYFGPATIQYTVNDNEGATSDPALITVTVNAVNDPPVAVNDAQTTDEDTSIQINILANDFDVDGTLVPTTVDLDPSIPAIQTSVTVAGGTFTVAATGIVTFVPVPNFFGTAQIEYTVRDNDGALSNVATITVTVNAVNDPPIANNDVASTPQGVPVSINILANDIDVDGTINPASIDLNPATPELDKVRTVASGTYTVENDGLLTFVPVPAFSGNSSITYTVADNLGSRSNAATISILVNFVNSPPVANDDAVTTNEDVPVSINVLANDTDDGGLNPATVDLNPSVSGIQNSITTTEGTFTVNASGLVTFTPALNFFGTAIVTYTVNDNIGETSNVATLTVTVLPVNDPPTANNDVATTNENTPVQIAVISNDTDVDGTIDPATVDLLVATEEIDAIRTVADGTFVADPSTGMVTFTPRENFFGQVTINYNVRDNQGAKSNNATITVNVVNVNDPPSFDEIADQRVLRNAETRIVTITGISPGPGETENVLLSAVSDNTVLIPHPTISYGGTGPTATLSFKPQANQSGQAVITVRAVDAGLNEFTRTFFVNVVEVLITSSPVTLAVPGEVYQYTLTTTEVDETLSFEAAEKPAWLMLNSTGKNTATLSGTPPASASSSNVRIHLRDGASITDQQQFVLNINRRPSSENILLETNEDMALGFSADAFAVAFSDPDEHQLAGIEITRLPRNGTILLGQSTVSAGAYIDFLELENLRYTPFPDYNGLDTVYFRVSDSFSFSLSDAFVRILIHPVNDPPRITFIEPNEHEHDIGREIPSIITQAFAATDVEGDDLVSAEIMFINNSFDTRHDLLSFTNTPKIKGTFDPTTGVLSLTGAASVAEYEEAIRSVTYTYINFFDIDLLTKRVSITISDAGGASIPAEREIKLIFDFVDLKIPQVFTPDGNGMNDYWPFASDDGLQPYDEAIIRVYDARGKLIFNATGFASPWNGKENGKDVPQGTYLYTIDLKYGKVLYKGSVTILRAER